MNWTTVTEGAICLRDEVDLEYLVCKIDYDLSDDENFRYVFTPNYSVISLLSPKLFQGIPGLALDKHKKKYIRENRVPVFLEERTPGENREDLWELLQGVGMTTLNRLEWLIRTNLMYSGDDFCVRRFTEDDRTECQRIQDFSPDASITTVLRKSLQAICLGHHVLFSWGEVSDENRSQIHGAYLSLLHQSLAHNRNARQEGTKTGARAGHYKGRKPIVLENRRAEQIFQAFLRHDMPEAHAIASLNLSRATFFRRLKKYRMTLPEVAEKSPGIDRKSSD